MEHENEGFTPSKKLNFIIGICAILISLASFYATYLQAKSAEQQVKAMTYPLIQTVTNNYDLEKQESAISLVLINSGVGPAIIKNVIYQYEGQEYNTVFDYLKACCNEEYQNFKSAQSSDSATVRAQIITSRDREIILAANDSTQTLYLLKHETNKELWNKLNSERRKLNMSVCYCSLLENCYQSISVGMTQEVKSCSH
ncbi:hypothetical protein FLL45_05060 [Aliikangiella marina]|uniref:Uncharacterized protein n=1 Tax=Aliikangiella marina TaxID=1712262 RepID=A0A545TJD8_9GAMM|nr:hypothetical protein [Aliikangiella marina]TQV77317.1 hypothetical protein FLL45_05060 [Aliikangiella marina]